MGHRDLQGWVLVPPWLRLSSHSPGRSSLASPVKDPVMSVSPSKYLKTTDSVAVPWYYSNAPGILAKACFMEIAVNIWNVWIRGK